MRRCKAERNVQLKFNVKHIKRFHPLNGVLAILFIFHSTKKIQGQWNINSGSPSYLPPQQNSYNDNNEVGDFYGSNNNFNGYESQRQQIPNTLNNYLQSFGGAYGTNVRGNVPVNVIDLETVNAISRNVDSNYQDRNGLMKFTNEMSVASTGVEPMYGNGGHNEYSTVANSQPFLRNGNAEFIPQQRGGYGSFVNGGNVYGSNIANGYDKNGNGYERGIPYQNGNNDASNFYGEMTNAVDNTANDINNNGCYSNMDCLPTATTTGESGYVGNGEMNNGIMPNVMEPNGVMPTNVDMLPGNENNYYRGNENQVDNGYFGDFNGRSKAMTFLPNARRYGLLENGNSMIKNSIGSAYGTNYGRNVFDYNNNQINNNGYGIPGINNKYVNNRIGNGDDYYDIPNDFDNNNNNQNENVNENGGFNPQNMKKYAEYLELINKKYGIGMPGGGMENNGMNNENVNQNTISSTNFKNTIIGNGGVGIANLQSTNEAISSNNGLLNSNNALNNGNNNSGYNNNNNNNNNAATGNENREIPPIDSNPTNTGSIAPSANTEECEKGTVTDSGGLQQNTNGGYGSLQGMEYGQPSYLSVKTGGYQPNSAYGGGNERRSCVTVSSAENEYRKENYPKNWKNGFSIGSNNIEETTTQSQPQPQPTPPSLSTTSIQTLTQQIRRLPSVFYLDSTNTESLETEQLLRKTYGLPLVAFYVDKIEKSKLVEKNLEQLTAYKQMPYLFICGTFIGSQEHINNYHKNKQIPQLVEYVCGENNKTGRNEFNKRSKVRRKKKKPVT